MADPTPAVRPAGGYRPVELGAAAVALVLPLAFVSSFKLPSFAPRWAALPVLAAAGLAALPVVLRGPRRTAAVLAVAWLAWTGLATLAAPDRTVALWGRNAVGTGWLFDVALVGCWALGSAMRPVAATLVERALLVAVAANATVAVLQQVTSLSSFGLALYGGRSAGLYGNPVYLAELLIGGLWLALCHLDRPGPAGPILIALLAAGLAVSGSRFGLALAVVAVLAAVPRVGRRRAAAGALFVLAGVAAGTLLAHASVSGGGSTAVDRVETAPASGIRPRVDTWRAGAAAVIERPVLGWGPNGVLAATSTRRTLTVARQEGPDRLFADAHDVLVEETVDAGLVGLALLLAWWRAGAAAARRSRSPLAGFAALSLTLMLVEPLHVGTTPLALLALGAAGAAGAERHRRATPARRRVTTAATTGLVLAGVVTTVVVAMGLVRLRHADLAADPLAAARATRLLPAWWEPAATVAQQYQFRVVASADRTASGQAVRWRLLAARRDPEDPQPWNCLGQTLAGTGDLEGAGRAFEHALRRDPWSLAALLGLEHVDRQLGLPRSSEALARRVAQLRPAAAKSRATTPLPCLVSG